MDLHSTHAPVAETRLTSAQTEEWCAAEKRLADRRHKSFKTYVLVMAAANALVVAFWVVLALAGQLSTVRITIWPAQAPLPRGFFWPVLPIAVCTVLVLLSARRAYPRGGYPAEDIEREMARVRTISTAAPTPHVPPKSPTPSRQSIPARHSTTAHPAPTEHELRRAFAVHVAVYLVINAALVAAWSVGGGFFWPVFLMTVWGAGVVVHGYLVFRPRSEGGARHDPNRQPHQR